MTDPHKRERIGQAIKNACSQNFGVLNSNFLCQSIGVLNPPEPHCVSSETSIEEVLRLLRHHRMGCVVVTDPDGKIVGIFSERDCVLKVFENYELNRTSPVSQFMTRDPVCESPQTTIAFALNLMSQGGFRHLPLVDSEMRPIAVISVKNVVDFIVESFLSDLLAFDLPTV